MENKLTWVELKKAVTIQTDLTEKEVNLILSTWIDTMVSALKQGEELHISGLGTFKMKTMKPRKSVDVTTGQAIVLPETDRLTFAMAASLEQQISGAQPVRIEVGKDPIQKLSDQADEILDILGELGQSPQKEDKEEIPPLEFEPESEQEPESESEPEPKSESEPEPESESEPEPEPEPEPKSESESESPAPVAKPPKKERLWLTALITLLVFIGVIIGLFFFFKHKLDLWFDSLREQAEMVEQVEQVEQMETEGTIVPMTDTIVTEVSTDTTETVDYRVYTEFIGQEQMHQDSRLAWMAYRYYGNKKLWVFIYDANKDHLTNPECIPVGTLIRIPKLDNKVLEYDADIQALVVEMYEEFLGKK